MTQAHLFCCIIFAITYFGVAIGGIPGLTIDRTGIALLGAIAMVTAGVIPLHSALQAIDASTLLLLFGLMLVSAQLQLSGFYTRSAYLLAGMTSHPRGFLALLMLVSGILSALLVNDIVCLVFTPILIIAIKRANLNPLPYLIALACSSNIGSAATLIGNPQNMLIGQIGRLSFGAFLAWSIIPVSLAGVAAYGIILGIYRTRLLSSEIVPEHSPKPVTAPSTFDVYQTAKGLVIAACMILLFFTSIPRELTALCAGGLLLCSRRMKTARMLGFIDWSLIILFCGLFIVIAGFETTGAPMKLVALLEQHGFSLKHPFALLAVAPLLSNLVSNVPAVMILTRLLQEAPTESWHLLAVASTFGGNLITIGSIANLIVIEQAYQHGVHLSFREHAGIGIPVTVCSLAILAGWMFLIHA